MQRYQVRWSNGYWKTFDSVRFMDVDKHITKADAAGLAKSLNAKDRRRG